MTASNDLTFIRCPSCRSLVPAVSSRCRMCGNPLRSDAPSESPEERKTARVRQPTASLSGGQADELRDDFEALSDFVGEEANEENIERGDLESAVAEEVFGEGPLKQSEGIGGPEEVAAEDLLRSSEPREARDQIEAGFSVLATQEEIDGGDGLKARLEHDELTHSPDEASDVIPVEEPIESVSPNIDLASASASAEEIVVESPIEASDSSDSLEVTATLDLSAVGAETVESEIISTPDTTAERSSKDVVTRYEPARRNVSTSQRPLARRLDFGKRQTSAGDDHRRVREESLLPRSSERPRKGHEMDDTMGDRESVAVVGHSRTEGGAQSTLRRDEKPAATGRQEGPSPSPFPQKRGGRDEQATSGKPREASTSRLFGWLVSYQDSTGASIELREGKALLTGSSLKKGDLVIDAPSISTPHAMFIMRADSGLFIQDLMSERGVWVRRKGQDTYQREEDGVVLNHGDWVRFGDEEFLVSLVPYIGVK